MNKQIKKIKIPIEFEENVFFAGFRKNGKNYIKTIPFFDDIDNKDGEEFVKILFNKAKLSI